ncbi:hypothetical protein CAPTEDRAFT_98040 [Capitella teleta]|uniref:Calpain catalytic domain-containing protein n=1 Tax=Capitella teleta TaxID=283909 RepID=R7UUX7_CAPTE|nr:hypothetical protein CAPTEDRAFT_98040 [Capitella teleta]|eukprot:ELU07186.1 hypothetical protein CAPTEDRAFT_98040 [Capitella teleta]
MTEYEELKRDLLRSGRLFSDPEFLPRAESIRKDGDVSSGIKWKRPKEISSDPKFIDKKSTRFDLDQGDLGDCWFIAGAASLAVSNRKLFERCVPHNQTFDDEDYAGIFMFRFWHFSAWTEVVIDDLLPTVNGRLLYAHNRDQPNEFWAALLEKAYAKLYGCYENIDGGHINDSLVDFTGGISEVIHLNEAPANLFQLMYRTLRMNSMVGCAINATSHREEDLGNGLYAGHAYSVTNIIQATVDGDVIQLIRLRNPWGRDEWKGAWSDYSPEWRKMTETMRKKIGLVKDDDGEFWMAFKDFVKEFDTAYFCHLYPDALTDEVAVDEKRNWWADVFHNKWVKGISAGGCGNAPDQDLFWRNPQFGIELFQSDDEDGDGKCSMVVSLMQKAETMQFGDLYISFFLYRVNETITDIILDGSNYEKQSLFLAKTPGTFRNMREVTSRYVLDPGYYVIIPCTFYPNKESDFLLRIYSEKQAEPEYV